MFSSFGQIEECRILRGPDGQSRGRCSFSTGTVFSVSQPAPSIYTGPSLPTPSTPKWSAIHLQWHPFHPHSLILSSLLHSASTSHSEGPPRSLSGTMARRLGNRWLLVFVGSAGRRLGSAQLLLHRLLHHTLQRLELACRCISYVALYCIKPQIAGSMSLSCWCMRLNFLAETVGHEFLLFFSSKYAQCNCNLKWTVIPFDVCRSHLF